MTEQIKKDMRGYLYPNSNKTKPTHPDYTGTCLINGQEYRIAAWGNKTSEGKEYLSIVLNVPLTPEQQNELKQKRENNNTGNNTSNNPNNSEEGRNKDRSEENLIDDDISEILNFTEDENPFD